MLETVECDERTRVQTHPLQARVMPASQQHKLQTRPWESPNSTRLVTSRLDDMTRSTCRVRRAVLFDKLDTAKMHGLDTSSVSCCVETWRDEPSGIWAILPQFWPRHLRHSILILYVAQWHLTLRLQVQSQPLHVDWDLGQVVNTHCLMSRSSIIWYWSKLGVNRHTARQPTHWPCVQGPAALAGAWLRPRESEIAVTVQCTKLLEMVFTFFLLIFTSFSVKAKFTNMQVISGEKF